MSEKLLVVSGSPHVHHTDSVKKIMWSVVIALIPAFLVSIYYFGINVVIITLVSIFSCLFFEYLIQKFLLKTKPTISDGSAVITGLLLAFNLPSNLPLHIVVIGALVAIGIGKMAFGGLGKNPFNPALVGRVFLLISFPAAMTSWPTPTPIGQVADALTGPTPLGILKDGVSSGMPVSEIITGSGMPDYVQML
ncbi:RnfABCDGE type electron transport complex subunit D, partial [Bacteroidales bacterium OttesenSCG-928-E04]|nr:RnfABCDGE type electron transport complex subunit D [Bacteroidales bacterium OttesenSCG-928-E04]